MKNEKQKDILYSSIESISDTDILLINKKYFQINESDIHTIKNRLYSAVYFGEICYDDILNNLTIKNL